MRGGPAGDLYIFVTVAPHPIFTRDGNNLYMKIPVPMAVATLGDKIEVPTIEGKLARLSIEAGTQSGRQFRMRGLACAMHATRVTCGRLRQAGSL